VREKFLKLEDMPTWEEVKLLWRSVVKAYNDKKIPLRKVVFFGLLFFSGMRLGEIIKLKKEDINLTEGTIRFEQQKKKKKVVRETIIHPEIKKYLRKYLVEVRTWLFPSIKGKDRYMDPRIAREWVYQLTKKVLGRRIRPHAFRHAVATKLLTEKVPLEYVRRVLGHSSYDTVRIYLNYTLRDIKEDIVEALEV